MKRKNQKKKGENVKTKRYYYNEHDDNQVEELRTKRKKRRLKKRVRHLFHFMIFVLLGLFIASPLSRVSKITVSGQKLLSEESILAGAGISEDDLHVLTYPFIVENKLLQLPMIKEAKVYRGFFYGLEIEIVESPVIGYLYDGTTLKIIDEAGALIEISASALKDIQQTPRLIGFEDETILKDFCEQLALVPQATQSLMSDIVFAPEDPYDKTRVEINMSDGKKVIVRIEDMAGELKYYQEILSQKPDACVYDIYGNKVYASPCD